MSTKYRIHGVPTILTKGAVDVLLDRCVSVRYGDGIRPMTEEEKEKIREEINEEMAAMLKKETGNTLNKVLFELSSSMKNAFSRSDA